MNAPILKLFGLFLVLFAALIGMTSYNSVIHADAYRDNAKNSRPQIEEQRVHRGVIRARDGTVLARSALGDNSLYSRRYTAVADPFAQVLGYDFLRIGRAGLERRYNDALVGKRSKLTSVLDQLRGKQRVGDNVLTNLDPAAQRLAIAQLHGRKGSVVAIEPATGKVRVMVSVPGYDVGSLDRNGVYEKLVKDNDNSPLLNRATQAGYAPGSTMKVVTATAALDSGEYTPDSMVDGKSPITISGTPLSNFSNEQFGPITLTTALTNSVNTVWAQVAEKLGHDRMAEYMKRFGFDTDPPMDYPDAQMRPSGVFDTQKGTWIDPASDRVDIGRVGIGQERLQVTPLQMAEVAATVANDGVRMEPHLVDRIIDVDGRTVDRIEPKEVQRVMSSSSARQLTEMMSNVVREGTGVGAALQGIQVAGKTGTAELNIAQSINQPWFIGFAPTDKPKVAVAVTLENIRGPQSQGGIVAAPIAKAVLQELLEVSRLAANAVIDDRYQIIGHLGTGGMAEVYCAQDLKLERRVALKLLHDRFAADEEFVERFRREASSAARLQHQYVVSVYDSGEFDGTPYIAMEYVDGRTLKQLVRESGPLAPAIAADLTVQVLRAARFAHRRGVIHRDFKPQNVIVDDEGRAKVTDFGIARAGASDMTQTGSIMGTAQYLSPEQAQGHAVNARSDLYSIGIILYELLTGRVPFDAESAVTVALKQVSETPIPPRRLNPAVTPELEGIVLRALAKDPADRFADADEFIAALEAAASRIPSPAVIAAADAVAASLPSAPRVAPAPAPSAWDGTRVLPADSYQRVEQPTMSPLASPPERKRWPWVLLGLLAVAVVIAAVLSLASPDQVQVPTVVGSSSSVAQQRLRGEGFKVAVVRDTSSQPKNTVVGQDPAGGEMADKGSTITLNISDGPQIGKVPDVVGDGRLTARRKLTAAGFTVAERSVPSDTIAVAHVVAQTPSGDAQAARGQKVTLDVSTGRAQVVVPDVTGKTEDDARGALQGAGFSVTTVEKEDEKADPGTVLSQDPAAGVKAGHGSPVTITVATEPSQVTVPDVEGNTQNEATETLSGRGLKVVPKDVPVDSPDQDGIVQAQDPQSGGKLDRGSAVTISVGSFDPDLNPDPTATTTTPTTTTTTPATTP